MSKEETVQLANSLGKLVARLLFGAAIVVIVPFIFIVATEQLFGASIRHGFMSYLSFWALYTIARTSLAPVSLRD